MCKLLCEVLCEVVCGVVSDVGCDVFCDFLYVSLFVKYSVSLSKVVFKLVCEFVCLSINSSAINLQGRPFNHCIQRQGVSGKPQSRRQVAFLKIKHNLSDPYVPPTMSKNIKSPRISWGSPGSWFLHSSIHALPQILFLS